MKTGKHGAHVPLSMGAALVAIGIVYGDIGTSPMYVIKSIIAGNGGMQGLNETLILGSLSLVFWTLTLLTTIKYVLIAMRADNHGEGGIFALYSLVKKHGKLLIVPAMIGGSALLADGMLTPAVTVTTAIEGLRSIPTFDSLLGVGQDKIIIITLVIIAILFLAQRTGTATIGKAFGPIMCVWFGFLAVTGIAQIISVPGVIRALNPVWAVRVLVSAQNQAGIFILGSVFLATTGAEALYSDMGHVGKHNIFISWPFVKVCLILNYLGQGAWLLGGAGADYTGVAKEMNPFFEMLPPKIRIVGVLLGTVAAIIASQALITGAFSLVSEASRLDLMPHMHVNYPSMVKGQIYIPFVNHILWFACSLMVLYFRTSTHMEAAYGLAITMTMLMTTVLLFVYIYKEMHERIGAVVFLLVFGTLEGFFFFSSLSKFSRGGYVALLTAAVIFLVMYVWLRGTQIEQSQITYLKIKKYVPQLEALRSDNTVPLFTDNLVYLSKAAQVGELDRDTLYSILDKSPKRANAYWFISIQITDKPYTRSYRVEKFGTDFVFKIQLYLGFKVEQRINVYLRQIISDLIASCEMPEQTKKYSVYENGKVGHFHFCLIHKVLAPESDVTSSDRATVSLKYAIRKVAGSPVRWYGLENSSIFLERVPLFVKMKHTRPLRRIDPGTK